MAGREGRPACKKLSGGVQRGADLNTAQLMPLPRTVACFSKIQIGFAFLVPAHPGSPGQRAVKRVCVCVLYLARTFRRRGSVESGKLYIEFVLTGRDYTDRDSDSDTSAP